MVSGKLVFAKHALKDAKKLASAGLKPKAEELLGVLAKDPFPNPPLTKNWLAISLARIRVASTSSIVWCTRFLPRNALCACCGCGRITNERA